MRNFMSALLLFLWVLPAQADYMATGFAVNGTGLLQVNKFMGSNLVTPGTFILNQLPLTTVPFSVSGGLVLKGLDCIVEPSAWNTGDTLELEVYTHTDSSGNAGTASGMTLDIDGINTSTAVQLFHYSSADVNVAETEGGLSIKLVTNGWTTGVIEMQCSIRYDGA